ncbi:MAG: hypothetical protein H6623_01145 [Bdellovibrionaceae bacterium]|nr:hypothetical protein [Pseudobdellovibrionaceae bacterium]
MRRALIYAHFDPNGLLHDYVIASLRSYREHCATLVFVSTNVAPQEIHKIQNIVDHTISRENTGYDFLSWKMGLDILPDQQDYDEIIFTNDSIIGPLGPIKNLFSPIYSQKDFWGISDNIEGGYHLQSYFLAFKKHVFRSTAFQNWLSSIKPQQSKKSYILHYETSLTQILLSAGFSVGVLYTEKFYLSRLLFNRKASPENVPINTPPTQHSVLYTRLREGLSPNPSLKKWKKLLSAGFPFIKKSLFEKQKMNAAIVKYIEHETTLNVDLIRNYLSSRD